MLQKIIKKMPEKSIYYGAKALAIIMSIIMIKLIFAMHRGDMLSIFKHGDIIWFNGECIGLTLSNGILFYLISFCIFDDDAPNKKRKKRKKETKFDKLFAIWGGITCAIGLLGIIIATVIHPIVIFILMFFTSYTSCNNDDTYLRYYFVKDLAVCQTIHIEDRFDGF